MKHRQGKEDTGIKEKGPRPQQIPILRMQKEQREPKNGQGKDNQECGYLIFM